MKKITMLKMQGCPYCAKAYQAIEELCAENPAYKDVKVEFIDENEEPEKAKVYAKDYYYLPSLFVEGKKIYEAHPGDDYDTIKAAVVKAFAAAE